MSIQVDKMSFSERKAYVENLRLMIPAGSEVVLTSMYNEPQMKEGLKGEVRFIDDIGQIHVEWENGSTLALDTSVDKFTIY